LTAFLLGAVLGLLHPVAGGVLRRGLKLQTCANILIHFLTIPGIFGLTPPPKYKSSMLKFMGKYFIIRFLNFILKNFISIDVNSITN
jgi:hypothetical protein